MANSRFFDSAKFSNIVTLQAPLGPGPEWIKRGFVAATPAPVSIPRDDRPLIEVDLSSPELRDSSGSWVITIDSQARFPIPGNVGDAGILVCPLVAHLSLGTGGSQQTVECDARNQSFQIPAANVRAWVGWDRALPPFYNAGSPSPINKFIFPTEVQIRAQIQRGFSVSRATRTQLLPVLKADPGPGTFGLEVPNFSRCFRIWGSRTDPFFTVPGAFYLNADQLPNGGSPTIEMTYSGANLTNPSGCPVPNQAQTWVIQLPNYSATESLLTAAEWDVTL